MMTGQTYALNIYNKDRMHTYKKQTDSIVRHKRLKEMRKQCDVLWPFIIKARAGFNCELAGVNGHRCSEIREAAHLVTRDVDTTRWDLRNGRCLCDTIHKYFHSYPVSLEVQAMKHWLHDWELMNQLKWQEVATSFDIEQKFHELLVLTESYLTDFPEFTERVKKARLLYDTRNT